jgi:hypothetical protein
VLALHLLATSPPVENITSSKDYRCPCHYSKMALLFAGLTVFVATEEVGG